MKIGILTFHNADNYGAVFQAYALQKYINNMGENCEIIDYTNKVLKYRYDINPFHSRTIKHFIKRVINYHTNKKNKNSFKQFRDKHIKLSSIKFNEENIKKADEEYDIFIAGSDQIWNLTLSGNDENYFMTFANNLKKRNSYAASLGANFLSLEDKKKLKKLIELQNYISIRENDGVDIIKHINNEKYIEQNIDPIFLLGKDEWKKIKKKNKYSKKYIFIYEVTYTNNLINSAMELAKEKDLDIYYVSASNKKIKGKKGVKNLKSLSPESFLDYIYNAEYILTSSFHGMAFSILFNKNFYYDIADNRKKNYNSRLESLAELTNTQERKLKDKNQTFDEITNFKQINNILKEEINKSYKYLNKVLKI